MRVPEESIVGTAADPKLPTNPTLRVLPVVLFNLLIYFVIGLPNAVMSGMFVVNTLGFDTGVAGTTITLQYLGTFATRLVAGQLVDKYGPKKILTWGLIACVISGLLVCLAAIIPTIFGTDGKLTHGTWRYVALGIALLSRLFIGWAESWTATSVTTWNMRRVGLAHTSVAISWNGVTSYGGIALGVTVGEFLGAKVMPQCSLLPVGMLAVAIGVGALILLSFYVGVKPLDRKGAPMSFLTAVRKVLPYGSGLAAGSFGFGTVNGFLSLYYESNHWYDIGLTFIIFAAVFIGVRILFSNQIDIRGGMPVAAVSLLTETIAMGLFSFGHSEVSAMVATGLTAAGFSLLFPALGTEAVKTDGPEYSGILLAAYSIFTDLTIFLVGPCMGYIKDHSSWSVMFAVVGVLCFSGIFLSYGLKALSNKQIRQG
ncbi:MFS transporter [Oecophyllibacter saccharovorans]|uniref:MFS transporter n=1 Tax=Oecophyllibacter saccharovorans TaxID=2558360 RepID=A0A506URT1_9PROT|nr:MFS transporter [Oecophyllibacter saccharovorans]TPW36061.1 MFS transporter [Oecophyllibacter saccharovorans]